MNRTLRRSVATAVVAGWSLCMLSTPALALPAGGDTGRVTGQVLPAREASPAGLEVLLLDESWDLVARARTGATGAYEFDAVKPGKYRMGVADHEGRLAPVVGPPTEVAAGGSAVVRIALNPTSSAVQLAPGAYGPAANSWWDRQTRTQKIVWTSAFVVGGGLVTWGVLELLDDDDEEQPASPSAR